MRPVFPGGPSKLRPCRPRRFPSRRGVARYARGQGEPPDLANTSLRAVAAVFSLALASCSPEAPIAPEASEPQAVAVSVVTPERRDLVDSIELAGAIVPDEQVTVYAKVSGYLKSLTVDIGDHVNAGQTLAEIDVPEMAASLEEKRAAIAQAEAMVEQAKAAVEQHEAEVKFQGTNHERLKGIRERDNDVMPQQEVDQALARLGVARGQLRKARADIAVAESAVKSAQAALTTIERLSDYATITAPISGVVTQRSVDPGALVQAASTSRTQAAPLVVLARVDRVRIVVDIPEPSAPYVARGSEVQIEVAGLDPITAKVSRTGGVLDPATRTLRAEIDAANPKGLLKPGMTVQVSMALRRIEGAITIPVAALQAEADGLGVYVVEGGMARRRLVETGLELPGVAEIISGLSGSDRVVSQSAQPLTDGAAVAPR